MKDTFPLPGRPLVPSGYGISFSAEGLLRWSDVSKMLASSRNYWLTTSGANLKPHVMPVWGLWLDDAFLFSTDASSKKARNLTGSPFAVIHLESGDDVVIVEGTVAVLTEASVLSRFAQEYDSKYNIRPDVSSAGASVYKLLPGTVFAWHERDYPKSATKWTFQHGSAG